MYLLFIAQLWCMFLGGLCDGLIKESGHSYLRGYDEGFPIVQRFKAAAAYSMLVPGSYNSPPCADQGMKLYAAAWPMACYTRALETVVKVQEHTHIVYMTRSAHPGFIAAARSCNVPIFALVTGCTDHSFNHGQVLLAQLLKLKNAAEAKKACETKGPSAVSATSLQFWEVTPVTPDDQVHRFYEKEPEQNWRSGLNKVPNDLETKLCISALRSFFILVNISTVFLWWAVITWCRTFDSPLSHHGDLRFHLRYVPNGKHCKHIPGCLVLLEIA